MSCHTLPGLFFSSVRLCEAWHAHLSFTDFTLASTQTQKTASLGFQENHSVPLQAAFIWTAWHSLPSQLQTSKPCLVLQAWEKVFVSKRTCSECSLSFNDEIAACFRRFCANKSVWFVVLQYVDTCRNVSETNTQDQFLSIPTMNYSRKCDIGLFWIGVLIDTRSFYDLRPWACVEESHRVENVLWNKIPSSDSLRPPSIHM